jgi:hypothetical protein
MMTELDHWQREDGFPSDAYFEAVTAALAAAGVTLEDWNREEDWEVNYQVDPELVAKGPLAWATHGLYVSWRCDEHDEPQHAEDFTGLGWYWVLYSKQSALGDFAKEFVLAYLAEPGDVAEAVRNLVTGQGGA